jgi:hypothetical protein
MTRTALEQTPRRFENAVKAAFAVTAVTAVLAVTPVSAGTAAPAAVAAPVDLQVDGKTVVQAIVLDGKPYVEAGALAAAAGLHHEHDWKVDGTRFVIESTARDRDAKIEVRETGVISRGVLTVDGRHYVPADDIAHALGGHAHYDGKAKTLRVSVGAPCSVCKLGAQPGTKSSL